MTARNGATFHRVFNRIVIGAILINTGVLVWGLIDHVHEDLIETLDYSLLWFFVFEIAVRASTARRRRQDWAWVAFDTIIIVLALLPLGSNVTALRVMRACRMLHFGRHMHHLPFTAVTLRRLADLRWKRGV